MSRNQPISDSEDSDAPFLPTEIIGEILKEIEGDDDLNHICEMVGFVKSKNYKKSFQLQNERKSNITWESYNSRIITHRYGPKLPITKCKKCPKLKSEISRLKKDQQRLLAELLKNQKKKDAYCKIISQQAEVIKALLQLSPEIVNPEF